MRPDKPARLTFQLRLLPPDKAALERIARRLRMSKSRAVRHLVALADNRTRKLASGE